MAAELKLVGVVNLTPDSFSDGGQCSTTEAVVTKVASLFEQGASLVDIGADSTRPQSVCVGADEEWQRLEATLFALPSLATISVDTHHILTARRAVQLGVKYINDVSGGSQELFELAADTQSSVIVMYSRCPEPHNFQFEESSNLLDEIRVFFDKKLELAAQVGLPHAQLILDPGMGAFISKDPYTSGLLLDAIDTFSSYQHLFLGISRKGFLRTLFRDQFDETRANESLDDISAAVLQQLAAKLPDSVTLYGRMHSLEPFCRSASS
jgi:dihydropteroate synthase